MPVEQGMSTFIIISTVNKLTWIYSSLAMQFSPYRSKTSFFTSETFVSSQQFLFCTTDN